MDLLESSLIDNSPRFSEYKISGKDIRLILEYASWAPSPYNSQPWEFIIVQEQEHIRRIAALHSPAGAPNTGHLKKNLENMPNLLFFLMDLSRRDPGKNFYKLGLISMGAAMANLIQAASEKEIAVHPFPLPPGDEFHTASLRKYLIIPENRVICGLFGLGYVKSQSRSAARETKLIVHNNTFGNRREIDKLTPSSINKSPFYLIRDRKSYRHKFLERPVSVRDEDSLVKTAMNSLNFNGQRIWELIFIKDKTLIDVLADLIIKISFDLYLETEYTEKMKTWTRYTMKEEREKTDGVMIILWKKFLGRLLKGTILALEKFTVLRPFRILFLKTHSQEFFGKLVRESPLLIAFIYSRKELDDSETSYLANLVNVGVAVQNILLDCTARNMGSQFLSVMMETPAGKNQVKKLLQLSDDIEIVEVIRVGYLNPDSPKRILSLSNTLRRPVEKIAFREFYLLPFWPE